MKGLRCKCLLAQIAQHVSLLTGLAPRDKDTSVYTSTAHCIPLFFVSSSLVCSYVGVMEWRHFEKKEKETWSGMGNHWHTLECYSLCKATQKKLSPHRVPCVLLSSEPWAKGCQAQMRRKKRATQLQLLTSQAYHLLFCSSYTSEALFTLRACWTGKNTPKEHVTFRLELKEKGGGKTKSNFRALNRIVHSSLNTNGTEGS